MNCFIKVILIKKDMVIEKDTHKKIDILRGIAILSVVLYHSQLVLFPGTNTYVSSYSDNGALRISNASNTYSANGVLQVNNIKNAILNFIPTGFGWTGVELFLLISGFLIHFGFLSNQKTFTLPVFFSKRFWRIVPTYLFALFFFCFSRNLLGYYLTTKAGLEDLLSHIFLVHNFSEKTFYSINGCFWSLALEMQLYLIYPVFLLMRKKVGITRSFLIVLSISFLVLIIGGIFTTVGNTLAYDRSVIKYWFIWCAGSFLAEKYYNNERIFSKGLPAIIIGAFLLTFFSITYPVSRYFTVYLATFAWLAFFEWLLATERVNLNSKLSGLMATIGICSYSIYLIHQPFLNDLLNYFLPYTTLTKYNLTPVKIIPAFLIILLISYTMYLFIELPSIQFGSKLRQRKMKKQAATPVI